MSRGLAVMRQNVDKLAADITKLQAIQQGALDRTAASPAFAGRGSGAQARAPAATTSARAAGPLIGAMHGGAGHANTS
jgi:hypothetical protein